MRIFKDSFIYLIGELFAKSLPFLMLPYLTRKLGPDGFGELSYYLTWLALFGIFIGLSQEGAVTRYFYFYGKKALNTVVTAGYLYNIAISAILLLGCWILKAEIIAYIVLATMFQSFLSVQLALRQCQKQPLKYITIQIILSLTNAAFTILALEFFTSNLVEYRILAIVAANGLTFFIASMVLGNLFSDENRLTTKRLKLGLFYIFSFGMPLILHQSSFFIKGQLDRFFIYQQYSKSELGVYSAAVQISFIFPVLIMAINKATVPYYYQRLKDKKLTLRQIKKYTFFSIPLSMIPAILSWIFPEEIYLWFLGPSYIGAKYYIAVYLLGYGLNIPYLILVNYLFYHAENGLIARVSFITSMLYAVLLLFFGSMSMMYIPFIFISTNILMVFILWIVVKEV